MRFPFDPDYRLIVVLTELTGPVGSALLHLALDTGATRTVIGDDLLLAVGYDPALATDRLRVTTGSRVESLPSMLVTSLRALGQERSGFPVLCHTLPPSASVDGLLGLDFLRGQTLTVDFRLGEITLT